MRLLMILLFTFLLSSCGNKLEREMLPGRYVFTNWEKDTIDIKSDRTYRHFTFSNGKNLENSGTWKLNSNGDEIHLMYANDINAYYNKVRELDSIK